MRPNDIEVLLHFHCSMRPHPRSDAPAVSEAIGSFLRAGLLEPTSEEVGTYTTTEGGRMLVSALCAVPLPCRVWIMPPQEAAKP